MMKLKSIGCIVVLGCSLAASAQGYERMKRIEHVYPIKENTRVEIYNKYGNVHVNTWEKDSVKIRIKITAQANRPQNADKQINRVRFSVEKSEGYVVCKTIYGQQGELGKLVDEIDRVGKMLFNNYHKVTINYEVFLPAKTDLVVSNKFGDIYMPSWTGDLSLDLSYGDLRARKIKNAKRIKLMYAGKAIIDEIDRGDMNAAFSDVIIDHVKTLDLKSRSCDISIEQADDLTVSSSHDKFMIEQVEDFDGSMSFTKCRIRKLMGPMDITSKYGDITVKDVMPTASKIRLMGEYTDYTINYAQDASVSFDLTLDDNGKDLVLPKSDVVISKDDNDGKLRYISGKLGKAGSCSLSINGKSSYVFIGKN